MSPAEELQPPPEAVLIRLARQARGLSPEEAAALTPIRLQGGRWRQIENGFERKNPPKSVKAPDRTLAHMAHTVGVTPEQLEEVGREAAAEILREILRAEDTNTSHTTTTLSPDEEVFRRIVTAAAMELGVRASAADEIMRRVRRDLEQAQPPQAPADEHSVTPERIMQLVPQYLQERLLPVGTEVGSSREIPYRVTGRTDLSDMLREARQEAGLSLEEVSERVVDPESGEHTVDADWLDRLERVALVPDEYPEYAQTDPLAATLGLDVMEVRAAYGAQFFGLVTIWSDDGQSQTTLQQEHATPEGIARAKASMARFNIDTTQASRGRK